jgi:hypothetical protein
MPLNINDLAGKVNLFREQRTDMASATIARVAATPPAQRQNTIAAAGLRVPIDARRIRFRPIFLPAHRSGPIVTADNPVCFNDRYDAAAKWYLPDFALKLPLQDSFSLVCQVAGVDAQANKVYSGEARFTVLKQMPAPVAELQASSAGTAFHEIPIDSLNMAFVVTLAGNSTLPYPARLTQDGDAYTLSINLPTQDSLIAFYRFISDPGNKRFCAIALSGTYFAYTPKPVPFRLNLFQNVVFADQPRLLRTMPAQRPRIQLGRLPVEQMVLNPAQRVTPATPNTDNDYDVKEALPFSRLIGNVNFDCAAYPLNYLSAGADNAVPVAFSCTPPFGGVDASRHQYSRFMLLQGDLGDNDYGVNQIFRNTYNGNFLAVPERYVIALDCDDDGQLLRPSAYMFTSIDVNDINGVNNSTATFQFNVAPDVSSYQLLSLKKLILKNLPSGSNKTVDDIFIEFPDRLHDAPRVAVEPGRIPGTLISPLGNYAEGADGSKLFHLQFQDVSIGKGNAEWVAKQLKLGHGDIIAPVTFDIDAGEAGAPPQSSMDLSLMRIAGEALAVHVDAQGAQYLVNRTLYDIRLLQVQSETGDPVELATAITIPANQAVAAGANGLPADLSDTRFGYKLQDHAPSYLNQVLNEVRAVNLDSITDDIIVTNNSGLFSMYKIASIDFLASIIKPGETDPANALCRVSKNLAVDGEINHVPFALPVAQYLSKWAAVYSTVINFEDGTQQVNAVQYVDDLNSIGKLINLTVSKLDLHIA